VFLDPRTIHAIADYMTNQKAAGLGRVVSTPGGELAYAHYKWASVASRKSAFEFWKGELDRVDWNERLASSIDHNIRYLRDKRKAWIEAVLEYLPMGHVMDSRVHLIGGYDSVVFGEDVALNLADNRFVEDHREALYYLVHELAHAGYFRYRKMPNLAGLRTLRELIEVVKLLTHLEGMGVISPLELRIREGGLVDEDYRVLLEYGERKARVREYFEKLGRLESEPDREIGISDYRVLDQFSRRPKRLWYVAGCHIAMRIEERLGKRALQDMVRKGHRSFFGAYAKTEDPFSL